VQLVSVSIQDNKLTAQEYQEDSLSALPGAIWIVGEPFPPTAFIRHNSGWVGKAMPLFPRPPPNWEFSPELPRPPAPQENWCLLFSMAHRGSEGGTGSHYFAAPEGHLTTLETSVEAGFGAFPIA
jgi:hypothetical protein